MPLELAVPIIGHGCVVHLAAIRGHVPIQCDCGEPALVMVPIVGAASCHACKNRYVVAEFVHRLSESGEAQTSVRIGKLSAIAPGGNASVRRLD